jgi:predicted TPR repeat methyltransferase
MYRVRARVFARVAGRLGVDWSHARVLDVGSGTGFYVEQWHRLGVPKVVGVDITTKAVEELRRKFPADQFEELDVGARPSHDSRLTTHDFSAVSAMDVLFHIVDDEQYRGAFVNIAAALQPGGWFLWSDNFLHHDTERVAHQASRSLAESEDAVRAAGLEIVERVPMFVLMNYPTDSRSRLARLAWTAMVAPAALAEPLGWLVGAALAPVDTWLTSVVRESPTTEIMVCRRGS